MARTKSTTIRAIECTIVPMDLVWYIARNNGAPVPNLALEKVLTENQAQVIDAMRDAAMEVLRPALNKLAGIQAFYVDPAKSETKAKGATK